MCINPCLNKQEVERTTTKLRTSIITWSSSQISLAVTGNEGAMTGIAAVSAAAAAAAI